LIIHQMWIPPNTSMKDMPPRFALNCEQWPSKHAGFSHRLWSIEDACKLSENIRLPDFSSTELVDLINVCRFPAMQADLCRLLILYECGGFWIDLKMIPKRPFLSELVQNKLVLIEHHPTAAYPDPSVRKLLNNSFFGSAPQSVFIKKVAALAFENVRDRKQGVWDVTGPRNFMTVRERLFPDLFDRASQDGIRLLRAHELYEVLIGFGWGSYNENGLHWFQRMKSESVYLDGAPNSAHQLATYHQTKIARAN